MNKIPGASKPLVVISLYSRKVLLMQTTFYEFDYLMRRLAIFLMLVLLTAVWQPAYGAGLGASNKPTDKSADKSIALSEVVSGIKKRYASKDFEADFVQESYMGSVGVADKAQGHLYVKSPAMMRWDYQSPEKYQVITSGKKLWIYREEDQQVMVGSTESYFVDGNRPDMLSNPSDLLDQFTAGWATQKPQMTDFKSDSKLDSKSKAQIPEEDNYILRLVPKKPQPEIKELILSVSKKNFEIVEAASHSPQGDKNVVRFKNIKYDSSISSALFDFKIPKGTEVLSLDGK